MGFPLERPPVRYSWLALALALLTAFMAGLAVADGFYALFWFCFAGMCVQTIMAASWLLQAGAAQERRRMTLGAKRARRRRHLLRVLRREREQ